MVSFLLNWQQPAGPVGRDTEGAGLCLSQQAGGGGTGSSRIPATVFTLPMRFTTQRFPRTVFRVLKLFYKGNLLCVGFIFKHHHCTTLKLFCPPLFAVAVGSCRCPEAGWRRGGQGVGTGVGGCAALLALLPGIGAAPRHAGGPMPPSPPHCSLTCCPHTGHHCDAP